MIPGRSLLSFLVLLAAARAAAPAPAPSAPLEDTVITSNAYDGQGTDTEMTSDFTGNVVVTGTNMKLTCDRLIAVTNKVSDKTATIGTPTTFKSMVAIGHVHMRQNDGLREAFCGQAQLFPAEDKIVLTHDPVVIDGGNGSRATGDVIELYHGSRRATGKNVRVTFPPMKDLGFDKNEKPASPPSADVAPGAAAPAPKKSE